MTALGDECEAYAAYRNALARARTEFEPDELADFEADLAKAHAAMEAAWLEQSYAQPSAEGACMPPFILYTFTTAAGVAQCYAYAAYDADAAQAKGEQLARIAAQSGQPAVGFMVLPLQPVLPE